MRKKLFAVIMSAMMMITFMPTMAFATNGPTDFTVTKYQNNFTEAVGYLGDDSTATFVVGTIRTYDESDGTIEVQPDCGAYTWVNSSSMTGYYYDLTNTVCTKVNTSVSLASLYPQSIFNTMFTGTPAVANVTEFKFKVPSYVENPTATAYTGAMENSYKVTINKPAGYVAGSFEKQEFKAIPVNFVLDPSNVDPANDVAGIDFAGYVGTLAPRDFVVNGEKPALNLVKYYVDNTKGTAINFSTGVERYYDGAEHKIVTNNVPGVTFTYKQYNFKTANWDDVNELKFKNYSENGYLFQITPKLGNETGNTITLTVNVKKAPVTAGYISDTAALKAVNGSKVDAYDYFEVAAKAPAVPEAATYTSADAKTVKKAIKADYDLIKTYLKAVYDFTATPQKYNETKLDLAIALKAEYAEMTSTELAAAEVALVEKYPEIANFDFDNDFTTSTAVLSLVDKDTNDVTAINQTKTFHVKNAKALKAKKTFKLKGDVADWGTITYVKKSGNSKITVAKDGKVTVKKGLKKGTYKVKIKVKAPKVVVAEYKTLKVKVVK